MLKILKDGVRRLGATFGLIWSMVHIIKTAHRMVADLIMYAFLSNNNNTTGAGEVEGQRLMGDKNNTSRTQRLLLPHSR